MPKVKSETYHRRRSLSDPLAVVMLPPPDETPAEKERRLLAEHKAKKISDGIDEMIRQESKKKKASASSEVKVLLLGQSESGKSTTLKQFQLMHTPAAFHVERIAWRPVIYLNLVRSIRRILEAISPEVDDGLDLDDSDSVETASVIISSEGRPSSALCLTRVANDDYYRSQLAPLADLEDRLIHLLSSSHEDEAVNVGPTPVGWEKYSNSQAYTNGHTNPSSMNGRPTPTIQIPNRQFASLHTSPTNSASSNYPTPITPASSTRELNGRSKKAEVAVHTTTNWKKAFALGGKEKSPKSAHTGEIEGWWEDPDDPVHALNACAPAMLQLWRDESVRQQLREKKLRLEESSGFYLDEIQRITAKKYIPTNDDVLKARLKTVGVIEHSFILSRGYQRGVEWKIYDVGGARNQRQAWAPYFEDVNAIIFLAPISAFDQVLAEDPRVNRLEDSLLLWKSVVSNKLLAKVNIVLFLNKCDLLQTKLQAGVRLSQHMISYGDRPNDYSTVSKYFRNKFGALHQSFTPDRERQLFIHLTAVTDTRRTSIIISNVRDIIIKGNLQSMSLA